MAKKAAARKKVNGKSATKPKAPAKPKGGRQGALPGMGQVRHTRLDDLCASIGDAREALNTAKADEEAGKQAAIEYMGRNHVSVYKHAGIELVLVPGHDALRVRLAKGDVEVAAVPTDAGDGGDIAEE